MAENYFPSSTGLGQGGAQVLKGRTPQLSASGIVRGIEQVGKDIREEQAYQKQIELAKAKEKNERLKSLDETITKIQLPDNVAVAQREVNGMWDRINKGEDYETVFQETIGNIERLRKADNFQVQSGKQLEGKRYWDEEKEEYYYAGDLSGEYMDGNIADIEALEEGGIDAYVGGIYQKFDPLSKNWYNISTTDFNKEVVDYLNGVMKLYGEEDVEVISVGGREGIKTTKAIPPKLQEKLYKKIEDNEQLMDVYLASIGEPYRHKPLEEKKAVWKPIVKDIAMPKTVNVSNIRGEEGGKGLIEGEDYNVASMSNEGYINPLTGERTKIQSPIGKFGDVVDEEVIVFKPTKSPKINVKSTAKDDDGNDVDVTLQVDVSSVYTSPNGYVAKILKPTGSKGVFTEDEVILNKNQIAQITSSGIDLNERIPLNKGKVKETTTTEDLNQREQERRGGERPPLSSFAKPK